MHIYPNTVKTYFQLGMGRQKKNDAIKFIDNFIATGSIEVSDDAFHLNQTSVKKDDLADCLLQALCHLEYNN
jgi:hypothetical protein